MDYKVGARLHEPSHLSPRLLVSHTPQAEEQCADLNVPHRLALAAHFSPLSSPFPALAGSTRCFQSPSRVTPGSLARLPSRLSIIIIVYFRLETRSSSPTASASRERTSRSSFARITRLRLLTDLHTCWHGQIVTLCRTSFGQITEVHTFPVTGEKATEVCVRASLGGLSSRPEAQCLY